MDARKIVKKIAAESAPPFEGDLKDADRFLSDLDPSGIFTFQSVDDDSVRNDKNLNRVLHGTFDEHKNELVKLNACGAGIFAMINRGDGRIHADKKTCLSNESVIAVRATFISIDDSTRLALRGGYSLVNRMVQSSVGRYDLYGFGREFPLSEFGRMQKRFAKSYKGILPVCELSAVMRLPGFINHKAREFRVTYFVLD
jgi:hypothetical protein